MFFAVCFINMMHFDVTTTCMLNFEQVLSYIFSSPEYELNMKLLLFGNCCMLKYQINYRFLKTFKAKF